LPASAFSTNPDLDPITRPKSHLPSLLIKLKQTALLSLSDTPASADRRRLLIVRAPLPMAAVDQPPLEEAAAPALKRSGSIDRIPGDARRILHRLAGELWGGDVDPSALAVSQLKGAMTNQVFRITWPGGEGDPRKVLVRIYGQGVEVFFDRVDEVRTFECMSRHGQGPRLLGRFASGRVEEFINARVRAQFRITITPASRMVNW
jgi:choline/ethanolamine kinase